MAPPRLQTVDRARHPLLHENRAPPPPMKLATLKDGSRDGQLAVVSRDLASAHFATGHARTLQQLLDDC